MSISGVQSLERRLNELSEYSVRQAVASGIEKVRSTAVFLCPGESGELRQSIYTQVEERGGIVTGTCYTNKAYAIYVEFGTGPKGMRSHEGISPDVTVSYSTSPWWIHESMIDKALAEKYHWFKINTRNGIFYQCSGQEAQPFMYPAMKNNKEELIDGIRADFQAYIKELTNK